MIKHRLLLVMLLAALSGCSLPVTHTPSGIALPSQWDTTAITGSAPMDSDWWRAFGSPELTTLVQTAREGSFDVAAAVARVRQADALARIAGAALLPEIEGSASVDRSRVAGYSSRTAYAANLAASYEVDIWGANRATRQAALDTLTATRYARDAVMLTVTASVADVYLQTLALRDRAGIAHQNLTAGERILRFIGSQYRAGAATALELAQQRTLVAQLQQSVTQIDQQARDSLTLLAVLVGRPPQGFDIGGERLAGIAAPRVSAGVPADLLTRRPDVAQAERQLAAADADVTVARAAMLPSVTLTVSAGLGSDRLHGLFDHPIYDLAAGLTAPIFNAGRLSAGRDLALAQREELLANYRRAIMAALGDVETALNAVDGIARRKQSQDEVLAQAREALHLADSRYRAGAETLLTLIDAQRTLYDAQDQDAQLQLAYLQASVSLYSALGGGWSVDSARTATDGAAK